MKSPKDGFEWRTDFDQKLSPQKPSLTLLEDGTLATSHAVLHLLEADDYLFFPDFSKNQSMIIEDGPFFKIKGFNFRNESELK